MKKKIINIFLAGLILSASGCGNAESEVTNSSGSVTEGTEVYRGFIMDNVLHSESDGDIHYHVHIPESYDGSEPYALFFTLPGYEGLYFQGVGENLYSEDFGFTAQEYVEDMIIVAPQLSDWGETSADQTIALVEYFLKKYNIDRSRVYGEGYSGGGETMSLVMGKRPELFTAYLQCKGCMSRLSARSCLRRCRRFLTRTGKSLMRSMRRTRRTGKAWRTASRGRSSALTAGRICVTPEDIPGRRKKCMGRIPAGDILIPAGQGVLSIISMRRMWRLPYMRSYRSS